MNTDTEKDEGEGLAGARPSRAREIPSAKGQRFVVGLRLVWGIREPKLIIGAVPGKQRLRMRNAAAAELFVRTDDGVRCFVLEDREHYWFVNPRLEQGRNVRYRYEPIGHRIH